MDTSNEEDEPQFPLLSLLSDILGAAPEYRSTFIKCGMCHAPVLSLSNTVVIDGVTTVHKINITDIITISNALMVHTVNEHGGPHGQEVMAHILGQAESFHKRQQRQGNASNN